MKIININLVFNTVHFERSEKSPSEFNLRQDIDTEILHSIQDDKHR